MKYAIVRGARVDHMVLVNPARHPFTGETPELRTLCGQKRWITSGRVYTAFGKAKKATSCLMCKKVMESFRMEVKKK